MKRQQRVNRGQRRFHTVDGRDDEITGLNELLRAIGGLTDPESDQEQQEQRQQT
jgi:hypothetical protein